MSFGLPEKTACMIRFPKKALFAKGISVTWRRHFTEAVQSMRWCHKLEAGLLNVNVGEKVREVHLFELKLRDGANVGAELLLEIDRRMPYHLIFVLVRETRVQAWMSNKEIAANGKIRPLKRTDYLHTPWMARDELKFTIDGLTMDEVYESLVHQIAALAGYDWQNGLSIAANLEREGVRTKLARQIAALTRKVAQTKQFNRQIELRDELRGLQEEYDNLNKGI